MFTVSLLKGNIITLVSCERDCLSKGSIEYVSGTEIEITAGKGTGGKGTALSC